MVEAVEGGLDGELLTAGHLPQPARRGRHQVTAKRELARDGAAVAGVPVQLGGLEQQVPLRRGSFDRGEGLSLGSVREIVVLVLESWVINDASPVPASSAVVLEALQSRIDSRHFETWLTSSSGRLLVFVTNAERAMVMLFEDEGDPGEHAVDPAAEGLSFGFVLSNGQGDGYSDEGTVPLREAFRLVEHIVSTGSWPADAWWVVDR
ncbi:hypothetical protein ACFV19_34420 [Streptomyces griseoluteus]|uniref:hypothetical protein n=1 Tax=Streptomyces griseoluteus TaxID=29306 RepID=UPI0036A81769